jgi:hypothetical protein
MLAAAPSAVSATFPAPELQTAALPVLPRAAASSAAPDQTARPAPAVAPVTAPMAPSGPVTPVTAPAPLSPPASLTPVSAAIHVADPPAGNAGPSRDVDSIPIALPMQVAVRFASPGHADDRGAADSGTDVMSGFASAGVGGASGAASNEPAGAAIPAGFNPVPPNPTQAASAPLTAPPHAAVMTDAVPLAGIPIAIVARAEGGEKKFEIRLDPPDLGRIEVQLNVDSSGRATSHLVVDRADTLDLLRRSSRCATSHSPAAIKERPHRSPRLRRLPSRRATWPRSTPRCGATACRQGSAAGSISGCNQAISAAVISFCVCRLAKF